MTRGATGVRTTKAGSPTSGKRTLRRIAIVTGTRAEYGLLKSTMTALAAYKNVELQLVVTGSHLLKKFGHTIDDIESDGWMIDARIPMQRGDDAPLDQAQGLARGIAGIAGFLSIRDTDIVLILGDRIEAMAAALAAVSSGRFLAHIHGGDLAAGHLDDSIRHAITKLAHLHFPATREAARRIIRLGEDRRRVHLAGAPGLDGIRKILQSSAHEKGASPNGARVKRALVLQHPCGRSVEREREVMRGLLQACDEAGLHVTCLYPNTDAGHRGILQSIEQRRRTARNGEFRAVASMPRDDFLHAMRDADVLLGNSSSGIIESAFVGTPAVNIGDRQKGRQISGSTVIHCEEHPASIRCALAKALRVRRTPPTTAYGNGQAGRKIAAVLARTELTDALRRKLNSY